MNKTAYIIAVAFLFAVGATAIQFEVVSDENRILVTTPKTLAKAVATEVRAFLQKNTNIDPTTSIHEDSESRFVLKFAGFLKDEQSGDAESLIEGLKEHLEKTFHSEFNCCCNTCEFGLPCCVCQGYDFIIACASCTPKANFPDTICRPVSEPTAQTSPSLLPQPLRPSVAMPRLSLTFLNRWSSTSPRSPKTPRTASPKSANSNSGSPHTPKTRKLFMSSSDAEADDSNSGSSNRI